MQHIINLRETPNTQTFWKKRFLLPGIILIILVIAVVIYFLKESTTLITKESPTKEVEEISISQLDGEKYWAVFLTNEQVYFGHLKNLDSDFPQLTDVYYFILRKPLQGQLEEGMEKLEPSLIKMGNEIHGPLDSMIINKDHILFVEQLKDDSKVVKAIKEYKQAMQY